MTLVGVEESDSGREPVVIERGDPRNGPGLPRPLARHEGVLRPVPWTNRDDGWGLLHDVRAYRCDGESLCLVCGEYVETGYIFATDKRAPAVLASDVEGDLSWAADNGPLHSRCAKMTVAHCARIRNDLLIGEVFMVPYCRHTA